ncbi:protein of unknown function [Xenorhabdus poinarii G6]|uniref:Uncharacterized protein n=1 Tax=Xenorhabdus poinarii G6 TaxID=1354304 RepID=A0A068R954_9GAMM|nr:protein of unknown function [Xenorhabdus poinarii G6]
MPSFVTNHLANLYSEDIPWLNIIGEVGKREYKVKCVGYFILLICIV